MTFGFRVTAYFVPNTTDAKISECPSSSQNNLVSKTYSRHPTPVGFFIIYADLELLLAPVTELTP